MPPRHPFTPGENDSLDEMLGAFARKRIAVPSSFELGRTERLAPHAPPMAGTSRVEAPVILDVTTEPLGPRPMDPRCVTSSRHNTRRDVGMLAVVVVMVGVGLAVILSPRIARRAAVMTPSLVASAAVRATATPAASAPSSTNASAISSSSSTTASPKSQGDKPSLRPQSIKITQPATADLLQEH